MSWVRIWVHVIFATQSRVPHLDSRPLRFQVFNHIKENATKKGIWLDCVNGYEDHAHCLISLGKEQSICKVAQLIKGESSFWINKNKLTTRKFRWQDDYWAVSVSESHVERVRRYIHRQEIHHSRKKFLEEINVFVEKYGWEKIRG